MRVAGDGWSLCSSISPKRWAIYIWRKILLSKGCCAAARACQSSRAFNRRTWLLDLGSCEVEDEEEDLEDDEPYVDKAMENVDKERLLVVALLSSCARSIFGD